MKKMLLVVSLFVAGLVMPLSAHATLCGYSGQVVRTYDASTYTYAYLRSYATTNSYYYTYTTDIDLRNALRACKVSGERCLIYGTTSASSCPSSGYFGTTTYVYDGY